jgi:hypothetical protein
MGHTGNDKPIKYSSKVLNDVVMDMIMREKRGFIEYKQTMDREDLTQREWLQHAYEETLDLALYLKKILNGQGQKSEEM